jgi:hypothetical protein
MDHDSCEYIELLFQCLGFVLCVNVFFDGVRN